MNRSTATVWIGALALACAVGIPVLAIGKGQDANTACQTNAEQLAKGVLMYTQDYDLKFPPMKSAATFKRVVSPYVRGDVMFACPDSSRPYALNAGLSGKRLASVTAPAATVLFRDAKPHKDRLYTVAYVDGHVQRIAHPPAFTHGSGRDAGSKPK
jgi:prepilin-type processing-associated H-X9-DG protein